ncbi:MAG: hypothetical protein A3B07_02105 [Candidatus Yonathbacteria bacterium RIFCSPLOWO2_01_FULL_43_27]|uniref:Uncharacterized protein n=2 Tax=Parcubacteria group TaxID=1794811 RepID=A0A1G2SC23_9BACT|nr:MAG: hypothetical protein UW78_C0001G0026 [Candidatus Azambacteria bacterium GW2011_GWA1_44_9]OHA78570.1 MAG: hypothetical protein A2658_02160 [Candidatus Yonathbacteria bacterium RIFCSPHIGHO2_01_FULL_44_19]OHA82308.1 MAG: hypothetical protein A3B07_02105 [Candidatus Yonathbacteria bacterium RIFCSPLOWO2_01_FULL_43_27]
MEEFKIDPIKQKELHEEVLQKIDPRIAEILRKHLHYSTPQEEEVPFNEEPPKKTSHKNGPGAFIENSIPESHR